MTGIAVPPAEAIARPRVAYPITEPVLALRVTPEELLGLRYPSLAVIEAAQAASGSQRRLVAEWAVKGALVAADIAELPQLAADERLAAIGSAYSHMAELARAKKTA